MFTYLHTPFHPFLISLIVSVDVKHHVYKLMSSIQVDGLVRDAVSQGAKVRLGGQPDAKGGNFYQPTLLEDVTTKMRCSSEEIFGPVASIIKCVHTTSLSCFVLWSALLCRTCLRRFFTFWKRSIFLEKFKLEIIFGYVCVLLPFLNCTYTSSNTYI